MPLDFFNWSENAPQAQRNDAPDFWDGPEERPTQRPAVDPDPGPASPPADGSAIVIPPPGPASEPRNLKPATSSGGATSSQGSEPAPGPAPDPATST